jgi:hypothetical protein
MICEYLDRDPFLFGDELRVVDTAYVENMRRATTWGGGIEIKACCNIMDICVVVHNTRDSSNILFRPMRRKEVNGQLVISWDGVHYTFVSYTVSNILLISEKQ